MSKRTDAVEEVMQDMEDFNKELVKELKQSLQQSQSDTLRSQQNVGEPNNEFDVLMNNAIDEMTTEQQLEYYKEYYNLSRQQVADETHLESSRLRAEINDILKSNQDNTDKLFDIMNKVGYFEWESE